MAIFDSVFAPKIEDGGFFVLWSPKIEEPMLLFENLLPYRRRTHSHVRRFPHLRSSAPKNEESLSNSNLNLRSRRMRNSPPSSTFDIRLIRSKNPCHLRSWAPNIGPKIGRKTERGERLLRRWREVLRRWEGVLRFPGFEKNKPPSFDLRSRENAEPLPSSIFSAGRTKNTSHFFPLPPPPLRQPLTRSSRLSCGFNLQPGLPPWRSVRRSRSALYSMP